MKRAAPADLQRVARHYLAPENRTLYALLPTGTAPRPDTAVDEYADHPVQCFSLPNRLRLLVKEDHRLPFVETRALFQGGLLAETPLNNGITLLTAKMLLQGTSSRSAEQIASEIVSLGGAMVSYGGNNSFGLCAEVLSQDFLTGLELVADVLLQPMFPSEALERERQIQLSSIRAHAELLRRADDHDATKLESPEVEAFSKAKPLEGMTYGGTEFDEQKKAISGALAHHYGKNDHHPEHFKNGINDMNLIQLIEMFCDWRASSARHADGNIRKSLEINAKRFEIGQQLLDIMENTVSFFEDVK